jgi:hypothetical protein
MLKDAAILGSLCLKKSVQMCDMRSLQGSQPSSHTYHPINAMAR